jgi:hypothetical protein
LWGAWDRSQSAMAAWKLHSSSSELDTLKLAFRAEIEASWTTRKAPFVSDTSRLWITTCAPIRSGGCFERLNPRRLKCAWSLHPAVFWSVLNLPNLWGYDKIENEHGSLTHLCEYNFPSFSIPLFQCSICCMTCSTHTSFWYSKLPIWENFGGGVTQKNKTMAAVWGTLGANHYKEIVGDRFQHEKLKLFKFTKINSTRYVYEGYVACSIAQQNHRHCRHSHQISKSFGTVATCG